jgi:DNA invertase Pin-like site-specific DNA recombinase
MLIGYVRISKNDGTQNLDLQKDALQKEGVSEGHIYEDMQTGRHDEVWPGFVIFSTKKNKLEI